MRSPATGDGSGRQQRDGGGGPAAGQCAAFPYQIGGHHVILRHPHDKRLLVKPAFAKEVAFYTAAAQAAGTDDPALHRLIPAFHGVAEVEPIGECIVLEDLTFAMANPSILDIKMGRRLYDDEASEEKVQRTMAKAALSTLLAVGFRVNGIRVVSADSGAVQCKRDKWDVRSLQKRDLVPTLCMFFAALPRASRHRVMEGYLERLGRIKGAVQQCRGRFYSSSILFLHDCTSKEVKWDCRMIDFVHSSLLPAPSAPQQIGACAQEPGARTCPPDANYLGALDSLIDHLVLVRAHICRDPKQAPP